MKKIGHGVAKLSDRSVLTVFVGYKEGSKAYRVYDPVADHLHVTRDLVFEERRPWPWVADRAAMHDQTTLSSSFSMVYNTETGVTIVESDGEAGHSVIPNVAEPSTSMIAMPGPVVDVFPPPTTARSTRQSMR